jgi:hypothetical protein
MTSNQKVKNKSKAGGAENHEHHHDVMDLKCNNADYCDGAFLDTDKDKYESNRPVPHNTANLTGTCYANANLHLLMQCNYENGDNIFLSCLQNNKTYDVLLKNYIRRIFTKSYEPKTDIVTCLVKYLLSKQMRTENKRTYNRNCDTTGGNVVSRAISIQHF